MRDSNIISALKTGAFLCLILFRSVDVKGQEDTLLLPIFEKQINSIEIDAGTYMSDFDSITIKRYQASSLADLLREESFLNIRSNSPGNLSTLSFRGLSGVHTFIDWNGINLNSPSAGLTDLSLINVAGFDEVSVKSDEHNGSRLILGNKLNKEGFVFNAAGGLSSFGGYHAQTNYKFDIDDFTFKSHIDYSTRENDYTYRNENATGAALQTRENSSLEGINIKQDVNFVRSFRGRENSYSAHIWYSKFNRELPGSIAFLPSDQFQDDRSLRIALKTEMHDDAFRWTNTLGHVSDKLFYNFNSPLFEFIQEINTSRWHLNSTFKFDLKEYLAQSGLELRTVSIDNTNYTNPSNETAVAIWARGQRNWESARIVLHLRQEFSNVFSIPFTGSLGIDKFQSNTKLWASFKRIGRSPVFDDFFWAGSANPNLNPEKGWAFEGGWSLINKKTGQEEIAISIYRNNMSDWIQWIPDSNFIYSPTNYKSVTINGFSLNWNKEYQQWNTALVTKASISYNNAVNNTVDLDTQIENKDLIYNPNWKGIASLGFREENIRMGYRFEYIDSQYTNELNTNELPSVSLHNIYFYSPLSPRFSLNIELRNLTNRSYQSIQDFPMYGLNFKVDLFYTLNNNILNSQSTNQKVRRKQL